MATSTASKKCEHDCGRGCETDGSVCTDCLQYGICQVCENQLPKEMEGGPYRPWMGFSDSVCETCGSTKVFSPEERTVLKEVFKKGLNEHPKTMCDNRVLGQCHRLKRHMRDVAKLLCYSADRVTLVIGPQTARIECHKSLLGYYSAFFAAALYGGFAEGSPDAVEMNLPNDDESQVRASVEWSYTGGVFNSISGQEFSSPRTVGKYQSHFTDKLWIFADKILAPQFANDIMNFLFLKYANGAVGAATAKLIFTEAPVKSKLRAFFVTQITTWGPFNESDIKEGPRDDERTKDWLDLVAEGGDLVKECTAAGGFHNAFENVHPSESPLALKYLQDEGKTTVAECCKSKALSSSPTLDREFTS